MLTLRGPDDFHNLYLWKQVDACLLLFLIWISTLAIGIPFRHQLKTYLLDSVLTTKNEQGIGANRCNPYHCKSYKINS